MTIPQPSFHFKFFGFSDKVLFQPGKKNPSNLQDLSCSLLRWMSIEQCGWSSPCKWDVHNIIKHVGDHHRWSIAVRHDACFITSFVIPGPSNNHRCFNFLKNLFIKPHRTLFYFDFWKLNTQIWISEISSAVFNLTKLTFPFWLGPP